VKRVKENCSFYGVQMGSECCLCLVLESACHILYACFNTWLRLGFTTIDVFGVTTNEVLYL
jgi:hypothetical protein